MKRVAILLWFAAVLTGAPSALAAVNKPNVGGAPPPLKLARVLQAPGDVQVNWQALKGKVVVLEFWATWCGPCVAAIPHLNTLADHFRDKPVQFIAITDEGEQVVRHFLKRRPIHAWVGLDTDKSTFKAYGIQAIPHTVVVNEAGRIAAITYPTMLTEKHINDALAGKKLDLPEPNPSEQEVLRPGGLPGSAAAVSADKSLFRILVRPTQSKYGNSAWGEGGISILHSAVLDAIASAYGVTSARIVTNCALPEGHFDFVIKMPSKRDASARSWLRRAIATTFGLRFTRESRMADVYLLTAIHPNPENLAPTASTGGSNSRSGPGEIQMVNATLGSLAADLEGLLGTPVLDETHLTNHYDFELRWPAKEGENPRPQTLMNAMRQQLGLELAPATRSVELIAVDRVSRTKNPH
jgi:uncharacterized protein (TIGR03435 family)